MEGPGFTPEDSDSDGLKTTLELCPLPYIPK